MDNEQMIEELFKIFDFSLTQEERRILNAVIKISGGTRRVVTWKEINRLLGTQYTADEIDNIIESINAKFTESASWVIKAVRKS